MIKDGWGALLLLLLLAAAATIQTTAETDL
jgi:hypothetical protein